MYCELQQCKFISVNTLTVLDPLNEFPNYVFEMMPGLFCIIKIKSRDNYMITFLLITVKCIIYQFY